MTISWVTSEITRLNVFVTMISIVRLNMNCGRVDPRYRCTKLQSRIGSGLVYVIAVIRSFERPRSFRCSLECV